MKKRLEINGIIILMGVMLLLSILLKKTQVEIPVTSVSDSEIVFTTEDKILKQTWTPNVKNISEIIIPLTTKNSFEGIIEVSVWTDTCEDKLGAVQVKHIFDEGIAEELRVGFEKPIKVEIGKRHCIQISFVQASSYGEIRIPINSKFTGCSIGDKVQGAAQLTIGSEKNSRICWLVITYMPFVLIAMCFSVIFGRKLEETLGLSFGVVVLWIFLFGLIRKMELGVRLLFPISVLLFLFIVYMCNKRKIMLYRLFTPGIVLYGGGMLYVMIACQDYYRKGWDEYIQWGLAVKDMFIFNTFANHGQSGMYVKRYPPFTTILEYFFTYTNEMFSESILFVAYISMLFALLLIVFKKITWKNKRYIISGVIFSLLIPMVFFNNIYTLYVDLFLMVLVAYLLVCYFEEGFTGFNILRLAVGLAALVLTKDMGLVLAVMLVGVILVDVGIRCINKEFILNRKAVSNIFVLGIAVVGPFLMWQIYLRIPVEVMETVSKVTAQGVSEIPIQIQTTSNSIQESGIGLQGIWELVTLQAPEYKYQVIKTFLMGILYKIEFTLGSISFSYVLILVINLIITNQYRKKEDTKYIYRCSWLTIILAIGYALGLMITYLFAFPEADALKITSAERYLDSCIGGIVLAIWMMILGKAVEENGENKIKDRVLIFSMILMFCVPLNQLNPDNVISYVTEETLVGYDEIGEAFRTFCDKKDRVYYVSHYSAPLEYLVFTNYVYPIQGADSGQLYGGIHIYSSETAKEEEKVAPIDGHLEEGNIISVEQWENILSEYDYVYLYKPAKVFGESYKRLFENVTTIEDGACYKINKNQKGMKLEYIGIMK